MQQLCAVLQGCLSSNREERSQAEALLKQVCLSNAVNLSNRLSYPHGGSSRTDNKQPLACTTRGVRSMKPAEVSL